MTERRHGAAVDETGRPERADWTIDQGWENYSAEEHAVWNTLFQRQIALLPGRACREFLRGMADLPIGPEQIPDFRRLSDVLMRHTGWQVVAVPGLVPDEVFFSAYIEKPAIFFKFGDVRSVPFMGFLGRGQRTAIRYVLRRLRAFAASSWNIGWWCP